MLRKPVIYVRRITNLSDARYCAGMGVDLLGFVIDPSDVDYVSPAHYQEMIGWVAGPRRVVEVTREVQDWDEVIRQYKPDLLHGTRDVLRKNVLPDLPVILEISDGERITPIESARTRTEYLLINKLAGENSILPVSDIPILLSIEDDQQNLHEFLSRLGASGVSLQGSRELTPGLKDYDHLSRILEELEG